MLLEATNVSKAFGSFWAVAGADLNVEEGEIIGLIGPNGAGKSTFFNCLAGDTLPTGGRIMFDGKDLTRATPEAHARAGIGRTFQVPMTFEDMSVLDNVMVGAFLRHPHRNDAREHARRIVELTGLRPDQPRDVRSALRGASAWDRARVGHRAAAFVARRVPCRVDAGRIAGSDRSGAKIHKTGITIVIVEHIMEVIMTLTKRVLVFNQGHVIASGAPEAVVRDEAVIEAYLGRGARRQRE